VRCAPNGREKVSGVAARLAAAAILAGLALASAPAFAAAEADALVKQSIDLRRAGNLEVTGKRAGDHGGRARADPRELHLAARGPRLRRAACGRHPAAAVSPTGTAGFSCAMH